MTIGQEITGDALTKPGPFVVALKSVGNPDYGQNPDEPMFGVTDATAKVETLEAASQACRQFIDANDLGGGNWSGGQVTSAGVLVAKVSYNGRVWNPS